MFPLNRAAATGFAPVVATAAALALWPAAGQAHHLMDLSAQQAPDGLSGLLSGLAHPLLGPDHLLFLLALGLVGLRESRGWMLALLTTGLVASGLGCWLPGLPGAETLVALSLVVLGLVLCGRLPRWTLLPAFALHGYVLSASVIGWETTPLLAYGAGLLLSQALLLSLSLGVVRAWSQRLAIPQLRLCAGLLMGVGAAFAWTTLVP